MNPNFERGLILFNQNRYDMAEQEFRQALAADPDNPRAHSMLAHCLCEREQFQEATDEAQIAIHKAPDSPHSHYTLAYVYHRRAHNAEALTALSEAVRLDPESADYHALRSAILFEERRWPEALESADRGLECDPNHVRSANLRAMALVKLGRKIQAGATIEAALAKDPEDADTHANRGWTLLEQNEPRKAMEHFKEALRLEPNNEWARRGIVEALKAHYFIYSLMLRYFLWMSKLSRKAGWGLIIGAYLGYRVLLDTAAKNPSLAIYITPIVITYVIFAVMTWIAVPLFNLVLRLNRFGRLALSRDQTHSSSWSGVFLFAGAVFFGCWCAGVLWWGLLAALVCLIMNVPIMGIYACPQGRERLIMGLFSAALFAVAALSIGLRIYTLSNASTFSQIEGELMISRVHQSWNVFIYGTLFSQFLANHLMSRGRLRR